MVPKILLMLPILFGQKYTVWPVTALALSARGLDNTKIEKYLFRGTLYCFVVELGLLLETKLHIYRASGLSLS